MRKLKFILPIFFYVIIVGTPKQDSPTSVLIPWELRSDDDALIEASSSSFQFPRSDAVDSLGSPIDPVTSVKQQFYDMAIQKVKQSEAVNSNLTKLLQQLVGIRVP